MWRLFEKIVNSGLLWLLETNNLFPNKQCGFRPRRSTSDLFFYLEGSIQETFVKKHYLLSVFFYFTKTFDKTWKQKILKTFNSWNICGHMAFFIKKVSFNALNYVQFPRPHHFHLCADYSHGEQILQETVNRHLGLSLTF